MDERLLKSITFEGLTVKYLVPEGDAILSEAKAYADTEIAALVNSAPETLDTLGELAAALQENESVVDALNSAITNKVDKVDGKGLSTNDYTTEEKTKLAGYKTETWTFKLENGTTVTKEMVIV